MSRLSMFAALAAAGTFVASTQAAVILPTNRVQVTSDAVFDTSFEPRINVATGELVPVAAGPVLTAFGEVVNITDAFDSDNQGTITGELTWKFTGQLETDPGDINASFSGDGLSVHYSIVSTIRNAELTFYDDESPDFNVLSLVGQSTGNSEVDDATDGEVYIRAVPADDDLRGTIEISFFRVSPEANFSAFKITQQYINNSVVFDVVDGSILDQYPQATIEGINAGQIGPYPPAGDPEFLTGRSFDTEEIDGVTVNAPVDEFIRANSSAVIQVIPEPASALLLGLGGLVLLGRRRMMA